MINIGVLVSGRGSNLESILGEIKRGSIKGARVSVVVSNNPEAKALQVAKKHGVAGVALGPSDSSESMGQAMVEVLKAHGVTPREGLVLLAGFMKILPKSFVDTFRGRIMNIHPSLLPAFPGIDAQRQALEYGVKVAGCTVHFVVPEVDAGPVVVQRAVRVAEGDSAQTLAARILREEHKLYPEAVRLFVEGRLRIVGRRVLITP
ncbi:MAG: phosphoribosylglycinamide formyltransferase [archaeon]|nr:MAG: phosphoribosylglycinamide formyltransferase [archaeon]